MNQYYLNNKVKSNLANSIESLKQEDLNNANFNKFKQQYSWISEEFDAQINQFYDDDLNDEILKILLSKNLQKEISLFNLVELKGIKGFIDDYEFIQQQLYNIKSNFYLRLNYYHFLINENLIDLQIIFTDLLSIWESLLIKAICDYRLKLIFIKRQEFLLNIYKTIQMMPKFEHLLKSSFDFLGKFWEFNEETLGKINFNVLEKYSKYLEEDPSILKIAELLGRYAGVSDLIEERAYNKLTVHQHWQPIGLSQEQVIGVTQSKDLSHILPIEVALLSDENLKWIFLKKFVEGRLSSLEFISDELVSYPEIVQEIVRIPVPEKKGPFIIAIDTSKSMQGIPEIIAKAISLAIVKIGLRERRPVYLINFSNKFNAINLSDFKNSINDFINFLALSFNSNTDIEPALQHTIKVLDFEDYFNADLLLISDLAAPDLLPQTIKAIERLKIRRNRFHAITIGNVANKKLEKIFTNNWVYDPRDPFTGEHIITLLEQNFISDYKDIDFTKIQNVVSEVYYNKFYQNYDISKDDLN